MIEIYDIECLKNLFTYTGLNKDTGVVTQFIIHPNDDDRVQFFQHLNTLTGLIGFNCIDYDFQIIQHLINNPKLTNDELYMFSQSIIQCTPFDLPYKEWNFTIPNLDLYKIMHYNNQARRCSLKYVSFSLDFPTIQDMPIHHTEEIEYDNIFNTSKVDQILAYNLNDVKITYELYKIVKGDTKHPVYKGVDKIALRKDLIAEFGSTKTWFNYNDVKLGDAINQITYLNTKHIKKKDFVKSYTSRPKIKVKDCIEDYIQFEIPEFKEFYDKFIEEEFNPQELPNKEQTINYKYLTINLQYGGLHTVDKPRNIILEDGEFLIDSDCASMYPKSIIERGLYPEHLGPEWLEGYKHIYNERIKAKRSGKKSVNEAYKLAINGGGL